MTLNQSISSTSELIILSKIHIRLILLFFLISITAKGQLSPHDAISMMTRGINLGNTHEPPYEAGWNNPKAQEYYFEMYKEAGFNFVRIPVRWDNYTLKNAPYTVTDAWLDRIEQVAEWGLSRGLIVVINSHHDDWIKNTYAQQTSRDRFDSIWSQISVRFQDKPENLIFEVLNEPYGLTKAQNDDMHGRILSIIRKTNPTRLVIFQGHNWGGSDELVQAAIPDDPYIIGSFHSYDPYLFGLEGQGTWGSPGDFSQLRSKFQKVKDWSEQHNIPVFLGEFGALSKCEYNSRMKHYRAYMDLSREFGFAPCAWDDGGDFRILKRAEKQWEEIKDILIYTSDKSPGTPELQLFHDSVIHIRWSIRQPGCDSMILYRRTTSSAYKAIATFHGDSTFYMDEKPTMNQYYYYKLVAHYPEGEITKTPPQRIFFPAWVRPVREPYLGSPHNIPGIIEAEDFDKGAQDFTYHDTSPVNLAGAYRPSEGVDIYDRNGTGFHIGNVDAGEWYEYTVNVKTPGIYDVSANIASLQSGGKFTIKVGDVLSDTITVTKSNSALVTKKLTTRMNLKGGIQIMRFSVLALPLFNIDNYEFDLITSNQPDLFTTQQKPIVSYSESDKQLAIQFSSGQEIQEAHLYSITGHKVFTVLKSGTQAIIQTSGLTPGIYIVYLKTRGAQFSQKVIIR